jgi:hypothetical protein
LIDACTDARGGVSPSEWHVVDSATGARKANITGQCATGNSGILSRWPSPSGVACSTFYFVSYFFDWTGASSGGAHGSSNSNDLQSSLSPDGHWFFYGSATASYCGSVPSVCIQPINLGDFDSPVRAGGHLPCLWIDDSHLLSPDAVLAVMSGQALVASLGASGECAGRFPGGL